MFLVVFRNRKRTDIDQAAYGADAEHMEELAREQPGYLSFKSYIADDGEVIALSEWADEESARVWGRNAEHLAGKARGRAEYYCSYTLFMCDEPKIHQFESGDRE